jgi:hypothetical protein
MANVEFGTCSLEKYKAGEAQRIPEEELTKGELYVARFLAIEAAGPGAKAFECPARVLKKNAEEASRYIVSMSLLNHDLQPWEVLRSIVRNGYMLGGVDGAPEEVGYLTEYNDGSDELQEIIEQNGRDLVLAPEAGRAVILS